MTDADGFFCFPPFFLEAQIIIPTKFISPFHASTSVIYHTHFFSWPSVSFYLSYHPDVEIMQSAIRLLSQRLTRLSGSKRQSLNALILVLGVLIFCFITECTIYVFTDTSAGTILSQTTFLATRLFSQYDRNVKELYFNSESKKFISGKVIVNLIQDEYAKSLPERLALFDEERERLANISVGPLELSYDESQIDFKQLMSEFIDILNENRLSFPHPERITTNDGKPVIWTTEFLDKGFETISERRLRQLMRFDPLFVKDLRFKHGRVVNSLPSQLPRGLYKGEGYVMVGGGKYTWFAFLSIQSLRKSGATLPLELMIPDEADYEPYLCNEVLPKQYNAKCVTFASVYGKDVLEKLGQVKGYQIKSFALLGSSFESALYLDSDNFAVKNPDYLFQSELFKKYQMITWPDFWRRSSSPTLYSVLGIKIGSKPVRRLNDLFTDTNHYTTEEDLLDPEERVNYHDLKGTLMDWSTEAGQLLLNKTLHFNTLLLSLYYNYDGPAGFHPLISQGGAGEGDKETYLLAAYYLKKMYYQVYKKPDKLYGTFVKKVNWHVDSTIVQMDPIVDYENLKRIILQNEADTKADKQFTYNYDYAYGKYVTQGNGIVPSPMFYHIHSPKMDPFEYATHDWFTNMEDDPIRNFGENFADIGYDIELWIWKKVKEDLCGPNSFSFRCFESENITLVCDNEVIDNRIKWLEATGKVRLENIDSEQKEEVDAIDPDKSVELDHLIFDRIKNSLDYDYDEQL